MSQLPNNMKNLFVIATVLSLCACGKSSNSSSSADTLANNSQNGALGSGSNHQLAQASQPFCIQKSIGLIALSSSSLNMSGGAHVAGDVIL
ncbi:MAG TPA: hypothetical protein VN132_15055, partial [Bdellovibrio sp.]|nr:hypothetical protein [Bdellovibrio sp.]